MSEYKCEECGNEATHVLIEETATMTYTIDQNGDPNNRVNDGGETLEAIIEGYFCEKCLPTTNKPLEQNAPAAVCG